MRFILRDHATLSAFQNMIYEFDAADKKDEDGGQDGGRQAGDGGNDGDGDGETTREVFDESSSTGQPVYNPTTTFTWPKTFCTPIRRASDTERTLQLEGFQESLRRVLREQESSYDEHDPRIKEYNSIKMSYPAFPEHEVTATVEPVPFASAEEGPAKALPADAMKTFRIHANSFYRHETVVVKFIPWKSPGKIHGMTFRRVVQILLLFKCNHGGQEHELAYVSWFETTRIAHETASGMYLLKRTKRRSIIPVTDIELPVNLMPKFGNVMGGAAHVKRAMDEAKEKDCHGHENEEQMGQAQPKVQGIN